MNYVLIEEKVFEKENFTATQRPKANTNTVRLFALDPCRLYVCGVQSELGLTMTALSNVTFKECNLLGLRFDTCNSFGLSGGFEGCNLNHSSFYKTNLQKTTFKDVFLHEVDLKNVGRGRSVRQI